MLGYIIPPKRNMLIFNTGYGPYKRTNNDAKPEIFAPISEATIKNDDKLSAGLIRVSSSSSTSNSFRKKWKFNSSFSQSKRMSCKCRKSSVLNLDECEPKEVSSVIRYLRLRKVCLQFAAFFMARNELKIGS